MEQLYLVENRTYKFNIYNDYFGHRELIIVDENGDEITLGVTNTWAFKSGKEYTGPITRTDGKAYAEGTTKQIQKIRIDFTPDIGYNISGTNIGQLKGRTGADLLQKFKVYASEGNLVNPNQEKFIVVFSRVEDFNYNEELKNEFLTSMIPAGLIPKQRLDPTVVDEFTYVDSSPLVLSDGSNFNFVN